MPVHPLIAARFPLIADLLPGTPPDEVPEEALAWGAPYGDWSAPAGVTVTEERVQGPHGPVRVRLYRPADASGRGLLWAHGGGFTSGDLDMPEAHVVALETAARTGAVVASVEYRLVGTGLQHPVPVDDVEAAWRWFRGAARDLGADPRRLAIGGASAGAFLAAAAALRAVAAGTAPAAVLLAYPALHFPHPALEDAVAAEVRALPAVLRFTPQVVLAIFGGYLGRITDIPSAETPGLADLTGFPPTRIAVSELDDLRSSGELFAQQLASRGIPVDLTVAEGMLHGHLNIPPVPELPEIGRTIDFLAAW